MLFGLPKETRFPFHAKTGFFFAVFFRFLKFASRASVEANFGKTTLSLLRGGRLASTLERDGRFQRRKFGGFLVFAFGQSETAIFGKLISRCSVAAVFRGRPPKINENL